MAISQRQSNVAQGAAAGSYFGPWGAVAGGVLGGVLGDSGPNATERREAKEAVAGQAYGIAQESFQYLSQGREAAQKTYRQDMASMTARFAATGASMTGSAWQQNRGNVIRTRDDALTGFNQFEDEYRNSEAYAEFKKDYRRQFKVSDDGDRKRSRVKDGKTVDMFSKAQLNSMQLFEKYTPGGTRGKGDRAYKAKGNKYADLGERYNEMLKPGIRAYEIQQFGTKAQKSQFRSDMDVRISDANQWYSRQVQQRQAQEAIAQAKIDARQAKEDQRGGDGPGGFGGPNGPGGGRGDGGRGGNRGGGPGSRGGW